MARAILLAIALTLATSAAYTQEEQDAALKNVEEMGMPVLGAFKKMTPKMLNTVLKMYTTSLSPGAFEHLDAFDLEIIYGTVSALNNCEMCASFHAMVLGNQDAEKHLSVADVDAINAGGVPGDEHAAGLVIAAKYAMAHKGIILAREAKHLATFGFDEEKMLEVIYASGVMSSMNAVYIHLIANGLELEDMLKGAGPFKNTVYKSDKKEL